MHAVQFLMNDKWHVSQEIRIVVFQESLFEYMWGLNDCLQDLQNSLHH
jgi:hypothetical protein